MVKIGMLIADRYEILEKIGTGGMSDVYKAKDHNLNRFVAVKVLKHEFSENANFVAKFRVEAQAAAGLEHPNIVNVYDVGEERDINYIVMELVDGITLKDYITKKTFLPPREAITITLQVALGLEAAHHNGIIHRDIKPHNIIISKEGKVKVTDFGIAKAATSNTITSNVMGSVHYTSPEQARGGFSDEKSDIYSLGITFFEMVTGRVPFNGDTTVAIAIKHIQDPMPSPRKYVPDIPFSVEQIILKCCEKSPDRRYQKIEDLIVDLKKALNDPEGDFVKRIGADNSASTRMITKEEREQIKDKTRKNIISDIPPVAESTVAAGAVVAKDAAAAAADHSAQNTARDNSSTRPDTARTGTIRRSSAATGRIPTDRDDRDRNEYNQAENSASVGNGRNLSYTSSSAMPGRGQEELPEDYDEDDEYDEFADDYYYDEDEEDEEKNVRIQRITTILSVIAAVVVGFVIIIIAGSRMGIFPFGSSSDASATASTQVTMPDVIGMSEDTARQTLENLGLVTETEYDDSSDESAGTVIGASEEEGALLNPGSTVTLTVSGNSSESNMVSMPNLYGMTEEEARSALQAAGLEVGTVTSVTNDGTYEAGTVVSQGYQANAYIQRGTSVDFSVASQVTYSNSDSYDQDDDTESQYQQDTQTDTDNSDSNADSNSDSNTQSNTDSNTDTDNGDNGSGTDTNITDVQSDSDNTQTDTDNSSGTE